MREVFNHHDTVTVGFRKSILEEAGIACFIRNEHTSASLGAGALGLVQLPMFNPTLCIVDNDRYEEAIALLCQSAEPNAPAEDWVCSVCGEEQPGSFEVCWKCPAAE